MKYQVAFYSEALREAVYSLPAKALAKFEQITERLENYGPSAQKLPHIRPLSGGLWEIRAIAADGSARVFYCMQEGNVFLMLHCFMKKSQETPKHELALALRRMKEVRDGR